MIKVVHVDLLNATEAEEHGKDNHPEDPEDLIILEGSAGAGHHIGVSTGSHPSAPCVSGADSPSSLADGSRWSSATGALDRSEEVTSSSLGNSLDALNVVRGDSEGWYGNNDPVCGLKFLSMSNDLVYRDDIDDVAKLRAALRKERYAAGKVAKELEETKQAAREVSERQVGELKLLRSGMGDKERDVERLDRENLCLRTELDTRRQELETRQIQKDRLLFEVRSGTVAVAHHTPHTTQTPRQNKRPGLGPFRTPRTSLSCTAGGAATKARRYHSHCIAIVVVSIVVGVWLGQSAVEEFAIE